MTTIPGTGGLGAGAGWVPGASLAVETVGLTRHFGSFCAVDGVSLAVPAGCFFGFLGPNGAGKSTTIKMLTGLLAPTSGTVRLLGSDVSDPEEAIAIKRRIGVVPENLSLFENLTAREFLTFIGRMYLLPHELIRERSTELLEVMDLAGTDDKLAMEFSHGMRKKLALAAALLPGPELLFLDEPFEGVDAVSSRILKDILKRCVERGMTVFLTSHVLEIVEKLCTDVAIIARGRLVYQERMGGLHQGGITLEERFLQVVGGDVGERHKMSWLEGE